MAFLRDAVVVMELGLPAHHEQAARLQVDVEHAPRGALRADHEPARRAEGQQRDRLALDEVRELVVVRRDAVVLVAVEVEADAVIRRAGGRANERKRFAEGFGQRRVVGTVVRAQARHVDFALVHHATPATPCDA